MRFLFGPLPQDQAADIRLEEIHDDIRVLCVQLLDQELPRRDVSPAGLPVEPTHPALKMGAMRGAGVVV